jgi:hypothetical protein
MKGKRVRIQPIVVALSAGVIILAILGGLLGYNYSVSEGQVSTLKDSGQTYCLAVNSVVGRVVATFGNVTDSLQSQIQADQSMIASINASEPTGYEGIITTLNGQITQDSAIIAEIDSYTSLGPSISYDFCHLVNGS